MRMEWNKIEQKDESEFAIINQILSCPQNINSLLSDDHRPTDHAKNSETLGPQGHAGEA